MHTGCTGSKVQCRAGRVVPSQAGSDKETSLAMVAGGAIYVGIHTVQSQPAARMFHVRFLKSCKRESREV